MVHYKYNISINLTRLYYIQLTIESFKLEKKNDIPKYYYYIVKIYCVFFFNFVSYIV
jgi:hypothetical protein